MGLTICHGNRDILDIRLNGHIEYLSQKGMLFNMDILDIRANGTCYLSS